METLPAKAWGGGRDLPAAELSAAAIHGADCVVILTDHSVFDYALIAQHAAVVVDTRNAMSGCAGAAVVLRLGSQHRGPGRACRRLTSGRAATEPGARRGRAVR